MTAYIIVTAIIFTFGLAGAAKKKDPAIIAFSAVMILWGLTSLI